MALNIAKEVARMKRMTVPELRRRYAEVFGEECRSRHKRFLVKRIAWRLQANAEGDLPKRARQRAERLANDADLRIEPPRAPGAESDAAELTATGTLDATGDDRLPPPGTVLRRPYKGRTVLVTVLDEGFEYEGDVYRSLSAVAKAVTGSHWNGNLFFRLKGTS